MEKPQLISSEKDPQIRASVDRIISNLSDLGGIGHEWDKIDADIKEEIIQLWQTFLTKEKDPRKAVTLIVKDLSDRRGLRQTWEQIDTATQNEIKRTWAGLIK